MFAASAVGAPRRRQTVQDLTANISELDRHRDLAGGGDFDAETGAIHLLGPFARCDEDASVTHTSRIPARARKTYQLFCIADQSDDACSTNADRGDPELNLLLLGYLAAIRPVTKRNAPFVTRAEILPSPLLGS